VCVSPGLVVQRASSPGGPAIRPLSNASYPGVVGVVPGLPGTVVDGAIVSSLKSPVSGIRGLLLRDWRLEHDLLTDDINAIYVVML
jgi:hypothetical protein